MKRFVVEFTQWLKGSPRVRRHLMLFVAVLGAALAVRLVALRATLPYPQHPDETTWANISFRMIQEGDPNPQRFRYPSLPVYLMTGGFYLGLSRAILAGEAHGAEDLGTSATPYYLLPRAAEVPKALFASASVLALALIGVIGYLLTRDLWLSWLAPLLACASATFHRLSWSYMNVDILGAAFALSTLAYLVRERVRKGAAEDGRGARHAVIAGVLAGLTVGSKYNLVPILVPCVLWFVLFERKRWLVRTTVVGAVSFATFVVTTPYAVLDFYTFVDDILKEVRHYATGHTGATVDRGLPMAWTHVRHFVKDFGAVPVLFAVSGWAFLVRRDVRLGVVILSYPVVFISYMCLQRVFFARNVVVIHLVIALGLAAALRDVPAWVARRLANSRRLPERAVRATTAVLAVLAVSWSLPWSRIARAHAANEPRGEAERWIGENVGTSAQIVVDSRLEMDTRPLKKSYRVAELDVARDAKRLETIAAGKRQVVVVVRERHRYPYMAALPGKKTRARFTRTRDDGSEVDSLIVIERRRRN